MEITLKPYYPSPLDTTDIELQKELISLTEKLAENAHDNWAKLRMQEGWQWGEYRDDTSKTHPCLVPYDELSESDKEYDRRTALETLKAIVALGFEIHRS